MIDLNHIDALARRLSDLVPPGLRDSREELQATFKSALQAGLGKLDLVTREEFEVQREVLAHARQGRGRLLGVTMPQRVPGIEGVPAIAEQVPGYAAPNWFSMFAPKGLPPAATDRLLADLALLRDEAELKARLSAGEAIMRMDGPAPLAARLSEEVVKWRNLIARTNISTE